jgi:hypothetical protein
VLEYELDITDAVTGEDICCEFAFPPGIYITRVNIPDTIKNIKNIEIILTLFKSTLLHIIN